MSIEMKRKMNLKSEPFVSIVTPVYNGEDYLAKCIESILNQQYDNYEYIIVNNCSGDRTLEIAQSFAKKDSRIHIHSNKSFVGVIENHNIALRLISAASKYCKVVSADDWIFPECLKKMVEVAESNPSVGIVGSYQIRGKKIFWQGLEYPSTIVNGRKACRLTLLDGLKIFGDPSSLLYRSDLIKGKESFYPNSSPHADVSVIFECLKYSDFGFVHQVLSYAQKQDQTISSASQRLSLGPLPRISDLLSYGQFYLNREEFEKWLKINLNQYYRLLASKVLDFEGKEFWDFHKSQLMELGYPFKKSLIIKAFFKEIIRLLLYPQQGCSMILRHLKRIFNKSPKGQIKENKEKVYGSIV